MKAFLLINLKLNLFIIFIIIIFNSIRILNNYTFLILSEKVYEKELTGIIIYSIIFFIALLLFLTLKAYQDILVSKTIQITNYKLKNKINKNINNLTYEEFLSKEIGVYQSWYSNDIIQIENNFYKSFFIIVSSLFSLLFAIIFLFFVNYYIAILAILNSIINLFISKLFSEKTKNNSLELSKEQENYTKKINNYLSGLFTIISFNVFELFKEKILNINKKIEDKKANFSIKNSSYFFLKNFCSNLLNNIILISFLILFFNNIISFGVLISSISLMYIISSSLYDINFSFVKLITGQAIFNKHNKNNKANIENNFNFENFNNNIIIKNLNFSYDNSKHVLKNINLTFEKGKKYAIIGSSGSGKTTLVKILMGLIINYEGEILIDNININNYNKKSLLNKFSYIDQNIYLFNNTIKDNITLFDNKYNSSNVYQIINSIADDLIKTEDDLNYLISENSNNLSKGQKQKIVLARSLLRNKEIFILDEATSAIDQENANRIEELLLKNPNITLIMITHHLNDKLKSLFNSIYNLNEEVEYESI